MNQKEFIKNLKNQYVDPEEIQLEMSAKFKELDSFDSLTGMSIIVFIKDEFNIDVSQKDFKAIETVQQLYDHIS
jgi:acyl carrier protein